MKANGRRCSRVRAGGAVRKPSSGWCAISPGSATFSGKVSALSIPDYRYALVSKVDFNAVRCGGSLASLNQQLDFVLTVPDVRGR